MTSSKIWHTVVQNVRNDTPNLVSRLRRLLSLRAARIADSPNRRGSAPLEGRAKWDGLVALVGSAEDDADASGATWTRPTAPLLDAPRRMLRSMGQQQMLLLVLSAVVVGLAIMVGLRAVHETTDRAHADALLQTALRVAGDAQAVLQKPQAQGGVDAFADLTMATLGYPSTNGTYTTDYGQLILAVHDTGLLILGQGRPPPQRRARTHVVVAVCGPGGTTVTGTILAVGGRTTGHAVPSCAPP